MGAIKVNLGGDRLGTGQKMDVTLRDSGFATHDLSRVVKTTATTGTVIPFLVEPLLPFDDVDLGIRALIRTHPTTGPLFGMFKAQFDVFVAPMRYYIAALHNNKNKVGMSMSEIYMPRMTLTSDTGGNYDPTKMSLYNMQQIAPDSLLAYLGIRGLGRPAGGALGVQVTRQFNAITALMYVDIYKMYYANQQEGIGAVMSPLEGAEESPEPQISGIIQLTRLGQIKTQVWSVQMYGPNPTITNTNYRIYPGEYTRIEFQSAGDPQNLETLNLQVSEAPNSGTEATYNILDKTQWAAAGILNVYRTSTVVSIQWADQLPAPTWYVTNTGAVGVITKQAVTYTSKPAAQAVVASYRTFDLDNIDEMREQLLAAPTTAPVDVTTLAAGQKTPYTEIWGQNPTASGDTAHVLNASNTLSGLLIKTHLSDRFNNWLNTDWIDGPGGVTETSALDVSQGTLTMDALNLSQKIYDLLNRVVAAGNTYKDWLGAVWNVTKLSQVEMPRYIGGASGDIVFEEIVSTAEVTEQNATLPLGSLAGKGTLDKDTMRGGKVRYKCEDEPSFLMGLFSVTPRVDYSQGNKWWNRLMTMDDWHKPQLDGIGFQDLVTDEIAAWDTKVATDGTITWGVAGKQPAWIEYMTSQNEIFGRFAIPDEEMFMTLARLYEGTAQDGITNLSTYIDPENYNNAFATGSFDQQHFWVQIGVDLKMRRKVSAKMIPNL